MHLTPEQRADLQALRARLRPLCERLETAIVHEESLWLAVGERLGREAQDGDVITRQDDERAAKIVAECWRPVE
jgi:hypothetical protein